MWTGLILAGGAATRMGRDKALLRLGGTTLLERAVDRVRRAGGEPVVVGPPRSRLPLPGVRRLDEAADGSLREGPLAALRFGLRATGAPFALALACDLPLLTEALLRRLAAEAPAWEAVVPRAGGELQVLCAAWGRGCLPAMDAGLAAGERALHPVLGRLRTRYLEEAELAACGGAGMFLNVNTPEDLARAAAVLERGG